MIQRTPFSGIVCDASRSYACSVLLHMLVKLYVCDLVRMRLAKLLTTNEVSQTGMHVRTCHHARAHKASIIPRVWFVGWLASTGWLHAPAGWLTGWLHTPAGWLDAATGWLDASTGSWHPS